jgi:FkbM family methyltransferase
VRGGLHPLSALKIAAGQHHDVRLRGVPLTGPHPRGVANTAVEVAAGEYAAPGFDIAVGERVVDVGANVGAFAVLAARRGAHVDAYEPHPETFEYLQRNTAGLSVRCIRAAIVGTPPASGTVALDLGDGSDTHHRVGSDGIEVSALTLADAVGSGCDLLKLDCEGMEFELIQATDAATWRRVRRVACEVHPWGGDASTFVQDLEAAGFGVRLEPRRSGLSLAFGLR